MGFVQSKCGLFFLNANNKIVDSASGGLVLICMAFYDNMPWKRDNLEQTKFWFL